MALKRTADWSQEEGARLKRRRKALGLTQADMGRRLGLGQAIISRMEHGLPPSTTVAACVRIYFTYGEERTNGEKTEGV